MVGLPIPPSLTHPALPAPPCPWPPPARGCRRQSVLTRISGLGAGGRLRWRYERGHVRPGCVKRDGAFWYLMAWRMEAGARAGAGLGRGLGAWVRGRGGHRSQLSYQGTSMRHYWLYPRGATAGLPTTSRRGWWFGRDSHTRKKGHWWASPPSWHLQKGKF